MNRKLSFQTLAILFICFVPCLRSDAQILVDGPTLSPISFSMEVAREHRQAQISSIAQPLLSYHPEILGGGGFNKDNTRIINGVPFKGLPAIGAILYRGSLHCTGTMIDKRTVLTAAHCVYGYGPGAMEFVVGYDSYHPDAKYTVISGVYDPNLTGNPNDFGINDIAVLAISTDFSGSPIALGTPDLLADLSKAAGFVGYGYTGVSQTGKLGYKEVAWIQIAKAGTTTFEIDTPGKNTCNGDSGGPAVQFKGPTPFVIGVTSWGDGPCETFGEDMRVDAYSSWITSHSFQASGQH